jgi:hypothetical protein
VKPQLQDEATRYTAVIDLRKLVCEQAVWATPADGRLGYRR